MGQVGLAGQLPGTVGLHQHIVRQISHVRSRYRRCNQFPFRPGASHADNTLPGQTFRRLVRRCQHRHMGWRQDMGGGGADHRPPVGELLRQKVHSGGFAAAADQGSNAASDSQQI